MSKETIKAPKCIIKGESYGNPISSELSETLKTYTNGADVAEAATLSGVGINTISRLMYRQTSLTEYGAMGIRALAQIAVINCGKTIRESEQAIRDLSKIVR